MRWRTSASSAPEAPLFSSFTLLLSQPVPTLTAGVPPAILFPNQSTFTSVTVWFPALSMAWSVIVPFRLTVSGRDQWSLPSRVILPAAAASPVSTQRSASARSSMACSVRLTGSLTVSLSGKLDDQ